MIRPIGRGNGCGGRCWILRHGLITSDAPFRDTPSRFSASACAFTTIKKSEPPTPCFAQPDWDSVFCAGRRLQFCTPALFDCGAGYVYPASFDRWSQGRGYCCGSRRSPPPGLSPNFYTTERALVAWMALVATTSFRLVQCSYLLCAGYDSGASGQLLLFAGVPDAD